MLNIKRPFSSIVRKTEKKRKCESSCAQRVLCPSVCMLNPPQDFLTFKDQNNSACFTPLDIRKVRTYAFATRYLKTEELISSMPKAQLPCESGE